MRRNMNRNYRPASNSGSRPLEPDHLELQDLDLELELLKRKRQIIEQQQQMLTGGQAFGNQSRQYGFNQPQQNFRGSSTHSNQIFSNQYDSKSHASSSYGSMLGKRPNNDPEWQSNSTPKRFTGYTKSPKGKYGADYKSPSPWASNTKHNSSNNSPWAEPKPLMSSKISPPTNVKNKKPFSNKYFGNKVSKSSPSTPFVNKLVSYPISQRKSLVEQSSHLVNKYVPSRRAEPALVLRADTPPTQKMAGRLELALGGILKDVKTKYGDEKDYKHCFISNILLRNMKQTIRERIRKVMLNKPVGTVVEIVDHYRKVFPQETDIEILNAVKEFQKTNNEKQISINLEYSDYAVKYFKDNMTKLVTMTMDEMLQKHMPAVACQNKTKHGIVILALIIWLEELYPCTKELDNSKNIFEELINKGNPLFETPNDTQTRVNDNDNSHVEGSEQNNSVCNDDNDIACVEGSEQNNSVCNDDNEIAHVEGSEENNSVSADPEMQENQIKNDEKQADNKELQEKESDNNGTEESTPLSELDTSKNIDSNKKDEKKSESEIEEQFNKIDSAICSLLKARLPVILWKHKNSIWKFLNMNKMFQNTKEAIMSKVKDKLTTECRLEISKQKPATEKKKNHNNANNSKNNMETSTTSGSSLTPYTLPYYVKIVGRPYLPKRKAMQTFLNDFNPKSIKKHKSLHLLFVGFDDKKNFDDIVAIKKTDLGNMTILISPNEPRKKNIASTANNDAKNPAKSIPEKLNDPEMIMDSNLNEQIDDLLISIRKQEESIVKEDKDKMGTEAGQVNDDKENNGSEATDVDDDQKEKTDTVVIDVDNYQKENTDVVVIDADNDQQEEKNADKTDDVDVNADTNSNDIEIKDNLEPLKEKEPVKGTPTRSSSRLSNVTPGTIRTRRASRLAQN